MNPMLGHHFTSIKDAFETYIRTVTDIFAGYRKNVESARNTYKPDVFENNRAAFARNAQERIQTADEKLHREVGEALVPLRAEIQKYATAAAPRDFVDVLRDINDFGLKLTRSEMRTYLIKANGNYMALRILAEVARKSGFELKYPSVEDYEAELDKIQMLVRVPVMYAPDGYLQEAEELLPDVPHFLDDGSVAYSTGRPTTINLVTRTITVNNAPAGVEAMKKKWCSAIVPTLEDLSADVQKSLGGNAKYSLDIAEIERAKAVEESIDGIGLTRDDDKRLAEAIAIEGARTQKQSDEILKRYML